MALLIGLAVDARAHNMATASHSVADDGKGALVATYEHGIMRHDGQTRWLCPAALGTAQETQDQQVVHCEEGFALLSQGEVRVSVDGACGWQALPLPDAKGLQLASLGPGAPLWLLAERKGQALVMRRKGGAWQVRAAPSGHEPGSFALSAGQLWLVARDATKGAWVLLGSTDDGDSWSSHALPLGLNPEPEFVLMAAHPSHPGLVHVRRGGSGHPQELLRSSDGGLSWQAVHKAPLNVDIGSARWLVPSGLASEATGTLLLGSTVAGVWRSTDGGASFALVPGAPRVGCLARQGSAALACTDDVAWGASLMRSDDGGSSWREVICAKAVAGPAACAKACAAPYGAVAESYGLAAGGVCGAPPVGGSDAGTPPDGGDGQGFDDAVGGGTDDANDDVRSVPQPEGRGCSAAPGDKRRGPASAGPRLWLFALLSALLLARRAGWRAQSAGL